MAPPPLPTSTTITISSSNTIKSSSNNDIVSSSLTSNILYSLYLPNLIISISIVYLMTIIVRYLMYRYKHKNDMKQTKEKRQLKHAWKLAIMNHRNHKSNSNHSKHRFPEIPQKSFYNMSNSYNQRRHYSHASSISATTLNTNSTNSSSVCFDSNGSTITTITPASCFDKISVAAAVDQEALGKGDISSGQNEIVVAASSSSSSACSSTSSNSSNTTVVNEGRTKEQEEMSPSISITAIPMEGERNLLRNEKVETLKEQKDFAITCAGQRQQQEEEYYYSYYYPKKNRTNEPPRRRRFFIKEKEGLRKSLETLKRQNLLWQWSVSIGYCTYEHGDNLNELVMQLQKSKGRRREVEEEKM